jgi:hypothetical protein
MLRVPCPKCKEISYTPDVEDFFPCPQCGLFFSGRYGQDRRREPRRAVDFRFNLLFRGQIFSAKTFDVSPKGVGIEISGKPDLAKSDILPLKLKKFGISSARIVWLESSAQKFVAGMEKN